MKIFEVAGAYASADSIAVNDWTESKNEGPLRVTCSNKYPKLEVLSLGRQSVFPKLEYVSSVDDKLRKRPIIIVGENGGGISSFVALHKSRGYDTQDCAIVKENKPNLSSLNTKKAVLIANIESIGTDAVRYVQAMTNSFTSDSILKAGFYMVTRDTEIYSAGVYSEFADSCTVTRIARFDTEEIKAMLCAKFQQQAAFDETADTILSWTGGQPLLVQTVLTNMETPDLNRKVFNWIRDNPPSVVLKWQLCLAMMLEFGKESPGYTQFSNGVRDLVVDRSFSAVFDEKMEICPIGLRPLSLAGWLSPYVKDNSPVWRFSNLHQFWAQSVFRHPKSFLIRTKNRV